MNKLFRTITLIFFAFFAIQPVMASTLSLSPSVISVKKGQNITLAIQADPAGTKIYTIKSSVSFPPELLEVVSFNQSSGWMPLSMPGYDSLDNTAGSVVKTAGYAGGIASTSQFGSLVFRAKASGVATISFANASLAYDKDSKNTLTGVQGVSTINISDVAEVSVNKSETQTTVVSKKLTSNVESGEKKLNKNFAAATIDGATSTEETTGNTGTDKKPLLPLSVIVIIAIGIIGGIAFYIRKK